VLRELPVPVLQQVPRRDAHHEETAHDEAADPNVNQSLHRRRVEDQGPEVDDLGAHHRNAVDQPRGSAAHDGHDVMARRCLLPRVRDDDPDGGEDRAE
jgi:hypothetical protein